MVCIIGKHWRKISKKSFCLLTPDGHIRIVIATTSLGMGVNIKDVEYIITSGPPKDTEDYIQAIGRAGKDGRNFFAILYCTGYQLRKCLLPMKKFSRTLDRSLRDQLFLDFDKKPGKPDKLYDYCSFCHRQCTCDGEKCSVLIPAFEHTTTESAEKVTVRDVTDEGRVLVRALLEQHRLSLV